MNKASDYSWVNFSWFHCFFVGGNRGIFARFSEEMSLMLPCCLCMCVLNLTAAVFLSIANYGKIFNKSLYFLGHKSQSTMRQLYRKRASTCSILMELLLFHAHVIFRKSCLCSADLASVHNNWQCVVTLQGPFVKNKVFWIWSLVKVPLCCTLKGGRGN